MQTQTPSFPTWEEAKAGQSFPQITVTPATNSAVSDPVADWGNYCYYIADFAKALMALDNILQGSLSSSNYQTASAALSDLFALNAGVWTGVYMEYKNAVNNQPVTISVPPTSPLPAWIKGSGPEVLQVWAFMASAVAPLVPEVANSQNATNVEQSLSGTIQYFLPNGGQEIQTIVGADTISP